jgi:hypothetical protein
MGVLETRLGLFATDIVGNSRGILSKNKQRKALVNSIDILQLLFHDQSSQSAQLANW